MNSTPKSPSRQLIDWATLGSPAIVLGAAILTGLYGLPQVQAESDARLMAAALSLDFTLVLPGFVYVFWVRVKRAPWLVLLPAFGIGYLAATLVVPPSRQFVLEFARWILVPAELGLLGYLVHRGLSRARSIPHGDSDFVRRVRGVAVSTLQARIPAEILTTELAVFYYAFSPIRSQQPADAFTIHKEAGYGAVLIAISMAILAETVGLHFLVAQWTVVGAWILTGLSLYGLLWIVGDFRAMLARPVLIESDVLDLRIGLRWEARIRLEDIESVEVMDRRNLRAMEAAGMKGKPLVVLGDPNVQLRLRRPQDLLGFYGLRRTLSVIHLRVDEADRFAGELSRAICARARSSRPAE